jgi:hypothetical protein
MTSFDKTRYDTVHRNLLEFVLTRISYVVFFSVEGPRSRCYGRTAALRLIVQPCDEDNYFFRFYV